MIKIMKTKFVSGSRYIAAKVCPWASRISKVVGGFMCFESVADYETWKNQK